MSEQAVGAALLQDSANAKLIVDTLRTEEQLGDAAGGLATTLQDHPMIGFYIQTPVKGPVAMLERFEAFAGEYALMLDELTE